jgi:DNA-binding response OmpR family regulator
MERRALVVDDEAMIREIFRIYLEQWGFEVITASNHSTGVALAGTQHFDLAFSDHQLLDGPGLEVLEAARSRNPEAVLFCISEQWSEPDRKQAENFGCFAFYKPCDWNQLHKRLSTSIRSRKETQQPGNVQKQD